MADPPANNQQSAANNNQQSAANNNQQSANNNQQSAANNRQSAANNRQSAANNQPSVSKPGLDPTPDPKVQVSAVNPPITPDQVVSMAEAPSSAVTLPDVKLQNIKISPVKNKTIQGHLAAIEAKMIATEKLMKDIVKLQKHQIKTDKDLHHRRKELYQNTSQEFLLDKTIDFRDPKDKDCTCINIPKKKNIGSGLPIPILPPGGPPTPPVLPPIPVPDPPTVPVPPTNPITVPGHDPFPDPNPDPGPNPNPNPDPDPNPNPHGDPDPWNIPYFPPHTVLPPFLNPPRPGDDHQLDDGYSGLPGFAYGFQKIIEGDGGFDHDPYDIGVHTGVEDWPKVPIGDIIPKTTITKTALDGLSVAQIWEIVRANLNDPLLLTALIAAGGLSLADGPAPFGEAGGGALVMARLVQLLQKGKLIMPHLPKVLPKVLPGAAAALASGGIIPYASGGVPSSGRDMNLYHSKSQEYFRNVSSKLQIPKFADGGFNLLNPMSWFRGDLDKATKGELTNVSDDTLAGKLYNRRMQQEKMMRQMGYAGGGILDWWNKGRNARVPNENSASWKTLRADDRAQIGRFVNPKNPTLPDGSPRLTGGALPNPRKGYQVKQFFTGRGGVTRSFNPFLGPGQGIRSGPTALGRQQFERPVRAMSGGVRGGVITSLVQSILGPISYDAGAYVGKEIRKYLNNLFSPQSRGATTEPSQNLENAQNTMMNKTSNQQPQIVPLPPDYIKLPGKQKEKTYDTFEVPGIDLKPNIFTRPRSHNN